MVIFLARSVFINLFVFFNLAWIISNKLKKFAMEIIEQLFGEEGVQPDALNMSLRAIFVFIAAFFFMRIAGLRTFGKKTVFDQITLLIVGSILGRSIVSNSPFLPSMLSVLILVILHRLIAVLNFKFPSFRKFIM